MQGLKQFSSLYTIHKNIGLYASLFIVINAADLFLCFLCQKSRANHTMTPLENNKTTKSYEDRKNTLKKKARELAILCDVPVCLICVDPDGTPETWPEEKERVVEVLKAYKASPTVNNVEGEAKAVHEAPRVFETWDPRFDYLPEESLMDVLKILERQSQVVDQVVGKEQTGKKRKIMHDKIKSKTVGDVIKMEAGLITRYFFDVVGLNHQTNSYTGNHSEISSFLGKISGSSSSDFHPAVDLELSL
ncbi:agamous MADS-box protein [Salix suchowensis]|nr:agamous MADS-box protein [Salix suchowensis]